ncbi:MAG: hypothetical protein IJB67_05655 [Firmicutes bacterium]|nr:hypothetical protein [Bacillota bacterium]
MKSVKSCYLVLTVALLLAAVLGLLVQRKLNILAGQTFDFAPAMVLRLLLPVLLLALFGGRLLCQQKVAVRFSLAVNAAVLVCLFAPMCLGNAYVVPFIKHLLTVTAAFICALGYDVLRAIKSSK